MPNPTHQADCQALKEILCRKSVRFGSFTLASGQKSDVYVDAKLTTYTAEAIPLVGRIFYERIHQRWSPEAVGGLTLGADPIAFAIARESADRGRQLNAFVARKESKKHGMGRYIEGLEQTEGLRVVVIDDVCTTGDSTAMAIERAMSAGMNVLGAICLVDRETGARESLLQKFACPLESIFTLSEIRAFHHERQTTSSTADTPVADAI